MKTITLSAKTRTQKGKNTQSLRNAGSIPGVVYGHNVKNALIEVAYRDFQKAFKQAGESSLISLSIEGEKEERLVLVHEFQRNHVTDVVTHIDFLQPSLKETVEVKVPLVLEGTSPAVKDFGGTLVKNISELEIKALPQKLPHEIVVNIDGLKTFEDRILAGDIKLPEGVTLNIKPEEIVISVLAQQDVEADLAKEITEDVQDIEKVEKEKKEEVVIEEPKE